MNKLKFAEMNDPRVLREHMESYGFCTLVTESSSAGLIVDHVPLIVLDGDCGNIKLGGHFAASNPACMSVEEKSSVRAIFHGPHTYISPTFYSNRINVPTWNYMVVHATGTFRPILGDGDVWSLLKVTSDKYEKLNGTNWSIDEIEQGARGMLSGVVAFEIVDLKMEGKFKLGQNRSSEDRALLMEAMAGSGDENRRAIARAMARLEISGE